MYHDLYMGESELSTLAPRRDEFDLNLTTGKLLARIVATLASEKHGDSLTIVVRTHRTKLREH